MNEKVGELKVNNNQVMCHLSMKLSDMFDQNTPCTFEKIRGTHSSEKRSHSTTLRAKVKAIVKIKSQCPGEQKTCLPKNFSRGSLSNWCDADISKTICRPSP